MDQQLDHPMKLDDFLSMPSPLKASIPPLNGNINY